MLNTNSILNYVFSSAIYKFISLLLFSITIGEEGGYFRVPIASAFLLFPPKAVEGEVTLTCSRVKYKEFAKPRDGELFVSRILKVEPENVTFKKPVTVLLSHSAFEDQVFFDFYELIVEDLSPNRWKELKTEIISSVEGEDYIVLL